MRHATNPSPTPDAARRPRAGSSLRAVSVLMMTLGISIACGDAARSAPAADFLSGDEVEKLIVGNTLQGSYLANQLTMVWYDNGVVRGAMGLTGSDDGTWEIKGDLYCHEWTTYFGGVPHCYKWRPQGERFVLVNQDAFRSYDIQGRIDEGKPKGY